MASPQSILEVHTQVTFALSPNELLNFTSEYTLKHIFYS